MYIAIDIGGTNLRMAESNSLDNPQLQRFEVVSTPQNYNKALETIKNIVGDTKVDAIGVGAPKFVHLSDWRGHDLNLDLEKMFHCPVTIANDAYAAALGEVVYGKTQEDFLLITWGTGIGGAFVHNQKVWATEMGHQIINQDGPLCPCGQRGCLEMEPTVNNLAQGIVNCLVISPVKLIVWAGGKAIHQPEVLEKIKNRVLDILKEVPVPNFKLATFGDRAGVYGALSLLKSAL